jgi:subtilisin family serine protease
MGMKKLLGLLSAATLCAVPPTWTAAQNAQQWFDGATSTTMGYTAWGLDLINIEAVPQTGRGVYVAVLDSGLVPNWLDYFPAARIARQLGVGFVQPISVTAGRGEPCGLEVAVGELRRGSWVGSRTSTHGTLVTSTILGYFYKNPVDAQAGFDLPPLMVRGVAPEVTVIPVKVLSDYQVPALPGCGFPGELVSFGTSETISAGLDYVTDLAISGLRPMVVNMSLGGRFLEPVERAALDRAIANGVIVVASAGNRGQDGMGYPGAYPPVISAGSAGWIGEWTEPGVVGAPYRMWWLQYGQAPVLPGSGEVADPTALDDLYVSDFSSRALPGQELDLLAPGSWLRGPWPGVPAYNHLPWWSRGQALLHAAVPQFNFYTASGTSMSAPHVASVAALMLQKNPSLQQAQVESILKATAKPVPSAGSRLVLDLETLLTVVWGTACGSVLCDPVGAGLLQADQALAATPP